MEGAHLLNTEKIASFLVSTGLRLERVSYSFLTLQLGTIRQVFSRENGLPRKNKGV